jgi:hypothetical protein
MSKGRQIAEDRSKWPARLLVAGHAAGYKVGGRQVGRVRTWQPARAAVIGTLDWNRELVFPVTKPVAEWRARPLPQRWWNEGQSFGLLNSAYSTAPQTAAPPGTGRAGIFSGRCRNAWAGLLA